MLLMKPPAESESLSWQAQPGLAGPYPCQWGAPLALHPEVWKEILLWAPGNISSLWGSRRESLFIAPISVCLRTLWWKNHFFPVRQYRGQPFAPDHFFLVTSLRRDERPDLQEPSFGHKGPMWQMHFCVELKWECGDLKVSLNRRIPNVIHLYFHYSVLSLESK